MQWMSPDGKSDVRYQGWMVRSDPGVYWEYVGCAPRPLATSRRTSVRPSVRRARAGARLLLAPARASLVEDGGPDVHRRASAVGHQRRPGDEGGIARRQEGTH